MELSAACAGMTGATVAHPPHLTEINPMPIVHSYHRYIFLLSRAQTKEGTLSTASLHCRVLLQRLQGLRFYAPFPSGGFLAGPRALRPSRLPLPQPRCRRGQFCLAAHHSLYCQPWAIVRPQRFRGFAGAHERHCRHWPRPPKIHDRALEGRRV